MTQATTSAAPLQFKLLESIDSVPKSAWNALVPEHAKPFLDWDFLQVLEETGCVKAEAGWRPAHLSLWSGEHLVAAAPAYLKGHSWGEFVYNDFRWPQLAAHFGVRYHPKLILSLPFCPVTAPRLLTHPNWERKPLLAQLAQVAFEVAKGLGLSSAHLHFGSPEELQVFEEAGFAVDSGLQYHWENRGEDSFDAFLGRFNAKRRHMIRSERRQLERDQTQIKTLTGAELDSELLRFASRCYASTVEKYDFGMHHLNERFFTLLGERLPKHTEVVLAEEKGKWLGSALNFRNKHRLFGRWWGALDDRRFLHFNACYYHSIERCLEQGIQHFEPGAGGEHKIPRGFAPTLVQSAHLFVEPDLQRYLADFLSHHRARVARFLQETAAGRG